MIEIRTLPESDLPYGVRLASMSVWRLDAIKKSGNAALDLPCVEVPGNAAMWHEREKPEFRSLSRFVVMRPHAVLSARRELIRFCFKTSLVFPSGQPRDAITYRFVHELLRLYAREPWSYVGLVDQIRRLGENELTIYDRRFVVPLGDDLAVVRHRRQIEMCERHPWRYRELRGYLQKTMWREMS